MRAQTESTCAVNSGAYLLSQAADYRIGSWRRMSWDSVNGPEGLISPEVVTREMRASAILLLSCEVRTKPIWTLSGMEIACGLQANGIQLAPSDE